MCDATFTFGQRGSHFFQCPSRRETFVASISSKSKIPNKLAALVFPQNCQPSFPQPNSNRSTTLHSAFTTASSSRGATALDWITSTVSGYQTNSQTSYTPRIFKANSSGTSPPYTAFWGRTTARSSSTTRPHTCG